MSKERTDKEKISDLELVIFGHKERGIIGLLTEFNNLKKTANILIYLGAAIVLLANALRIMSYLKGVVE